MEEINYETKNDTLSSDSIDKYYTLDDVACKCLSALCIENYDFVVEPSAGSGAFYNAISHKNKIGIDIEPDNKNILKQDWFSYDISNRHKNVLVVGNPPFGRYHSLSSAFLKKAFSFVNVKTVAFILPDVYKKYTRQRIIPRDWRIQDIINIGENAFMFDGKVRHIPCSFFIFDKSPGKDLRDDPYEYKDKVDFYFANKSDFDLFLFGAAPKRIITNPKQNNRGHFIKSHINVEVLRDRLMNIKWSGLSCASGGVYWLTQGEIIRHYFNTYCV